MALDLGNLPADPLRAKIELFDELRNNKKKFMSPSTNSVLVSSISDLTVLVASIQSYAEISGDNTLIDYCQNMIESILNTDKKAYTIISFERDLSALGSRIQKLRIKEHASNPVMFEIEGNDKKKALSLLKQVRSILVLSDQFEENQKRRLLNRINSMEKELFQPKGKLDVILSAWVMIGEAGGKFGKEIKPLIDQVKRIAQKGSDERDNLPAPEERKRLPSPDKD